MRFKLDSYLNDIPTPFQLKYAVDQNKLIRKGKFTTQIFLEAMIYLVSATNLDGMSIALMRTFSGFRKQLPPWASSLSRARNKVDWSWFKMIFDSLLDHCQNKFIKFDELRVIAIDGQQLQLSRTKDIVANGFNGRATGYYKETYLPRGFLVAAYDVINGVCLGLTFNNTLHEQKDARHLLKNLPSKAVYLYDRLFFSKKMIQAHVEHGSHFLFRCRRNAKKEIMDFFELKKLKCSFDYAGRTIFLIRVKNSKTGKHSIYATDLPEKLRKSSVIKDLYSSRWEIENFFRDSTSTLRTEQWHSKTYNGNMQEIYMAYWFLNLSRLAENEACQKVYDPEEKVYKKTNFKLSIQYIVMNLQDLWGKFYRIINHLSSLSKISTSKRTHNSRSFKRELKHPRSPYPHIKTGWNWGELQA